jgi:hypothetical protein
MTTQGVDKGCADRFSICREDLDRLHHWISRVGSGQTLTALARRTVRRRLRYGARLGEAVLPASSVPRSVRRWDPCAAWHKGDGVIFSGSEIWDHAGSPCFGEVIIVQGRRVGVRIDGDARVRFLSTTVRQDAASAVSRWRASLATRIEGAAAPATMPSGRSQAGDGAMIGAVQRDSGIDDALWRCGVTLFGELLAALRHDMRFVALDGRWFVRSLVLSPGQAQLEDLAQRMVPHIDRPLTVVEMAALSPSLDGSRDAVVYGLAMALRERPDLFSQVPGGARDRWVLSGPPVGSYIARLAAYDPETWVVLCEPGERLSQEIVARLWALGLFGVVVSQSPE